MQDGGQPFGNVGVLLARIGDRLDRVRLQLVGQAPFRVGRLPSQHLVPRTPERIEIAANVGRLAVASLLGRHVVHRADRRPGASDIRFERVIDRAGQAEVSHFDDAIAPDQQVGRLDVAVHDVLLESVLQRGSDLFDDFDGALHGNDATLLNQFKQVLAFDQLHRDVQITVVFAGVVDRHDVVVTQLRRRLGLGFETLHEGRVLSLVTRQHLQRDDALELHVAGEINRTHASRADPLLNLVLAQHLQFGHSLRRWSTRTRDRRISFRSHVSPRIQ